MQNNIQITGIDPREIPQAAAVVAEAMVSNPLHLAVFKAGNARAQLQQQKMFKQVLSMPSCNLFSARVNGRIVGVVNFYKPSNCQMKPLQIAGMLPGMFIILGATLPRVLKWRAKWEQHDPKEPHWHLGPIAVAPGMQGKGIGSAFLRYFCRLVDEKREVAYLETDKAENVRLYEKFGFQVIEKDDIYGAENWFMIRNAR